MPDPHVRVSWKRLAAGLGLALLIGATAYVSTVRLGGTLTAPRTVAVSLQGAGNPAIGPGIGEAAPEFVGADKQRPLLTDLDENPIRLADFAGKPLWIVFWSTWCTPCQQEASDIRAAYQAHQGRLAVLAIDVQEPAAAARAFAVKNNLDYTIGLDSTAAVKALYGGWGLPIHFFVDGDGVIRDRYLGQMTGELMEQHLQSILGPT
jgi:cytochrome c biogenesis protein CcmG, thiol:disulfide interchange protein DsbE